MFMNHLLLLFVLLICLSWFDYLHLRLLLDPQSETNAQIFYEPIGFQFRIQIFRYLKDLDIHMCQVSQAIAKKVETTAEVSLLSC